MLNSGPAGRKSWCSSTEPGSGTHPRQMPGTSPRLHPEFTAATGKMRNRGKTAPGHVAAQLAAGTPAKMQAIHRAESRCASRTVRSMFSQASSSQERRRPLAAQASACRKGIGQAAAARMINRIKKGRQRQMAGWPFRQPCPAERADAGWQVPRTDMGRPADLEDRRQPARHAPARAGMQAMGRSQVGRDGRGRFEPPPPSALRVRAILRKVPPAPVPGAPQHRLESEASAPASRRFRPGGDPQGAPRPEQSPPSWSASGGRFSPAGALVFLHFVPLRSLFSKPLIGRENASPCL